MLFWEGLGKWLEVRGSVVLDLKAPYGRGNGVENSPQKGTGTQSTLQRKAGRDPNTTWSVTSCGFSLSFSPVLKLCSPRQEARRIVTLGTECHICPCAHYLNICVCSCLCKSYFSDVHWL